MDEAAMTYEQLEQWRAVGADMGFEFDELGHPFKRGKRYDIDGEPYQGIHDWRPVEDDGDAFGVMVHYGLTLKMTESWAYVWLKYGQALAAVAFVQVGNDRHAAARLAIIKAAAYLVNIKKATIAADPKSTIV